MKKPIIGIVGRFFLNEENSIIELNEDYRLAIVKAGGIPIIILPPNDLYYGKQLSTHAGKLTKEEKENLYQVLSICDGIVMPGGSRWYDFDEIICEYAIVNDIPILGICLGMQILGSWNHFDGTMNSDQTVKNKTAIEHCQNGVKYVHSCTILDGPLFDILEKRNFMVNSRHHYHLIRDNSFIVDAYSEDGLIEAIHLPNHKFALGVQWHPENMIFYEPDMLKIFAALIQSSIKEI